MKKLILSCLFIFVVFNTFGADKITRKTYNGVYKLTDTNDDVIKREKTRFSYYGAIFDTYLHITDDKAECRYSITFRGVTYLVSDVIVPYDNVSFKDGKLYSGDKNEELVHFVDGNINKLIMGEKVKNVSYMIFSRLDDDYFDSLNIIGNWMIQMLLNS